MSLARAPQMRGPGSGGHPGAAKTLLDRVGAAVLLLLAGPWCLLIALAIRLDSPGPVFSRERLIGQWGEEFDRLRFRTTEPRTTPGGAGSSDDGGRSALTRVGRFLTRYSLHELPQLINVLKGDMSFVGPRPQASSREARGPVDLRRLLLKPGLAGLWLSGGQPDVDEDEPVDLDRYLRNWSVALDLAILWRAVRGALREARAAR